MPSDEHHHLEETNKPLTSSSASKKLYFRLKILLFVGLALILIITGIISFNNFSTYQQHMKQVNLDATVNADNATVQAGEAKATAITQEQNNAWASATTSTVAANPYPSYLSGKGKLTIYDTLTQTYYWSNIFGASNGSCTFENNALYAAALTNLTYTYCSPAQTFSNFAFEVQMRIIQGDCGGMLFRSDFTKSNFYFFRICYDGTYGLANFSRSTGTNKLIRLLDGSSATIHEGAGQLNRIAVLANKNTIMLYVNGQLVSNLQDSAYTTGSIALGAYDIDASTQVAFSNARVWTL